MYKKESRQKEKNKERAGKKGGERQIINKKGRKKEDRTKESERNEKLKQEDRERDTSLDKCNSLRKRLEDLHFHSPDRRTEPTNKKCFNTWHEKLSATRACIERA
jgi:hypothetical protein